MVGSSFECMDLLTDRSILSLTCLFLSVCLSGDWIRSIGDDDGEG